MTRPMLVAIACLSIAGCFSDISTDFPDGLEPWEDENRATLPEGDPCPEEITFVRTSFTDPDSDVQSRSVHAAACIHAPIADVFRAVRDPQTGRDPAQAAFRVNAYDTEPEYEWSYQTHVTPHEVVGIVADFDINWRHGVVEGTAEQPEITATRWQKTFGSSAIVVLEGSLVLSPLPDHPEITELRYQYHLNASASGHDTIEAYLSTIYGRLRQASHGETLDPNDCVDCATPPEGY